jgi:hypothetical protein
MAMVYLGEKTRLPATRGIGRVLAKERRSVEGGFGDGDRESRAATQWHHGRSLRGVAIKCRLRGLPCHEACEKRGVTLEQNTPGTAAIQG